MDNKPLLESRPPAYSPAAPEDYGRQGYGTVTPPQPGFQAPPPGFQAPPPYPYPNAGNPGYAAPLPHLPYPSTSYTIIQQPITTTSVVVVGGCPACRVGVLEDSFTCCGILCAIIFFPIGILFCLALRQRTCPNCGASFG